MATNWSNRPESKPFPLVISHRGASDDAPENTIAAFRLAVELGADSLQQWAGVDAISKNFPKEMLNQRI
ncbi:MAG: hypothetical protein IIC27_00210 [Chloroflexi bacterium]|nr:hypothetical protein [Chloroflexota bacterium]